MPNCSFKHRQKSHTEQAFMFVTVFVLDGDDGTYNLQLSHYQLTVCSHSIRLQVRMYVYTVKKRYPYGSLFLVDGV